MKKILFIIAVAILFSCEKEELEQEPTFIDNCGLITQKRYDVMDNCYEIKFKSYYSESVTTRCISESEFLDLEIGDEFCYGQIAI